MSGLNYLSAWLRQLIIALVLAGFLEMLIPENGLKKTAKLVIGLMVMLILIQPLLRIFKIPFEWDRIIIEDRIGGGTDSQPVLDRGLQIRGKWEKSFRTEQQKITGEKIQSIIGLIDEVDLLETLFVDSGSGPGAVLIKVVPAYGKDLSGSKRDQLTAKIKNSVRLVSGFSGDQIEVNWVERDQ